MPLIDVMPVFGLRLTTPDLTLRLPGDDELSALGNLAAEGIHDPSVQPFGAQWTDQPAEAIPAAVIQHAWSLRARWAAGSWELAFAVHLDGQIIGTQAVSADRFAIRRQVGTGSWLGRAYQGRGLGTQMRAAVLALAFDGLGAEFATTSAYRDNPASNGVSRKLGYQANGVQRAVIRGQVKQLRHLLLTRADWQRHRRVPVTVDGLEACRDWLIGTV